MIRPAAVLLLCLALACTGEAAVVVVRHCEPDPAKGHALTERGMAQARATAEALKGCVFTRIICTSHIRTYETAKIIRDALGLAVQIQTDDRFNQDLGSERDWVASLKLLAMRDPKEQVLLVSHAPVLGALFTADQVDASIDYGAATEITAGADGLRYRVLKR